MTPDYILDYWIEAVTGALDDVDKLNGFTDDDIKTMAKCILISHELEDTAF